jgi:hypothetical protein
MRVVLISEGVTMCCKSKSLFVPSAVKSILKKRKAEISSLPWVTPKKVLDDDDGSRSGEYDLSGRRRAINEYKAREDEAEYGEAKAPTCTFKNTEVVYFELQSIPMNVKDTAVVEPIRDLDPLEPFAARVLDRMMVGHEVKSTLQSELDRYHQVNGDCVRTVENLHKFVCEQANDIMERCESRLSYLPEKQQFDVRAAMKHTNWEADDLEEEADYHEKLLTRIPDALCQRFLKTRVTSYIVGLDATQYTLSKLQDSVLPRLSA